MRWRSAFFDVESDAILLCWAWLFNELELDFEDFRGFGEDLAAVGADDDHVFNTDTKFMRDINSWLNSKNHIFL